MERRPGEALREPLVIGRQLQKGDNTVEWRAGKLRTHYWLYEAEVEVAFGGPVEVRFSSPKAEHALFWEGRFSQCSYNAFATVLDHYYGVEGWNDQRDSFEKRVFVAALRNPGWEDTTAGLRGPATWPKPEQSNGMGTP